MPLCQTWFPSRPALVVFPARYVDLTSESIDECTCTTYAFIRRGKPWKVAFLCILNQQGIGIPLAADYLAETTSISNPPPYCSCFARGPEMIHFEFQYLYFGYICNFISCSSRPQKLKFKEIKWLILTSRLQTTLVQYPSNELNNILEFISIQRIYLYNLELHLHSLTWINRRKDMILSANKTIIATTNVLWIIQLVQKVGQRKPAEILFLWMFSVDR